MRTGDVIYRWEDSSVFVCFYFSLLIDRTPTVSVRLEMV